MIFCRNFSRILRLMWRRRGGHRRFLFPAFLISSRFFHWENYVSLSRWSAFVRFATLLLVMVIFCLHQQVFMLWEELEALGQSVLKLFIFLSFSQPDWFTSLVQSFFPRIPAGFKCAWCTRWLWSYQIALINKFGLFFHCFRKDGGRRVRIVVGPFMAYKRLVPTTEGSSTSRGTCSTSCLHMNTAKTSQVLSLPH